MNIWEKLLKDPEFNSNVSKRGYSQEIKFTNYVKQYNLQSILQRSGAITANLLSIDFYSKQAKELTDNNLFLLRTGQGKFVVFNQDVFASSYLDLKLDHYEELSYEVPKNHKNLVNAYLDRLTENPCLELMHFLGIFRMILERITGETEYFIGPRGNRTSKFEVYFYNNKEGKNEAIYTYNGQEELDYSIFSEKAAFVIESKNLAVGGLDIGWHKIAYPLNRFRNLKADIYPCYFLKNNSLVWLFVFPKFKFYNQGVILNDKLATKPEYIFRINLNGLQHYLL
jgi:hypothetical protein